MALALPRLVRFRLWNRRRAAAPLRLVFIDDGSDDARDGFTLGVEEARHAAALFGGAVEWTTAAPASLAAALGRSRAAAVVGGSMPSSPAALARAAAAAGSIYMNTLATHDALRAACTLTTFHVAPSDAMLRDARALAHAPESAPATAWDPSLVRFGADTLNARFRARFARPMTHAAWTNWFAVKALWEATLRARSTEAHALAAYLGAESTQFDGHKGRPLSFRTASHQLRQPVYVRVAAGRPLVEEPVQAAGEEARASLDRLGGDPHPAPCTATQR